MTVENKQSEIDFPEAIHHTEEPLTYLSEDVDDWFKQCIENSPYLSNIEYTPNEELASAYGKWFWEYFTQFFPHLCNLCRYGEDGKCNITFFEDGYLSGFEQSCYKDKIIRCSWFSRFDCSAPSEKKEGGY